MKKQNRVPARRNGLLCMLRLVGVIALGTIMLSNRQRILNRARYFNKTVLNPAVLKFAGTEGSPHAVICHVGRHSGRTYETPVRAGLVGDSLLIPMTYGDTADWYRNIRAAGRCTIRWKGKTYTAEEPELMNVVTILPMLSPAERLASRALGIKLFLKMKCLVVMPEARVAAA